MSPAEEREQWSGAVVACLGARRVAGRGDPLSSKQEWVLRMSAHEVVRAALTQGGIWAMPRLASERCLGGPE